MIHIDQNQKLLILVECTQCHSLIGHYSKKHQNVMHNDLQPKINTRKKCIKLSAFGHVACIETLCILIKLISIFNCDCSIIYMLFGGKGHFRVNVLWLLWLWVDWISVWIPKRPEWTFKHFFIIGLPNYSFH